MYRERPLLGFALIKSRVEKRLQRFSFIGDARKSCALLGFALIKSEVEKRLQRFSFIGDARKSCALLGFARSCPEGDLNPFGYVLPIRPLRGACARFRRHPGRLFLAPARRSLRGSSPEYFLIAINVLRNYFF